MSISYEPFQFWYGPKTPEAAGVAATLDALPGMTAVMDARGRVGWANRVWRQFLGEPDSRSNENNDSDFGLNCLDRSHTQALAEWLGAQIDIPLEIAVRPTATSNADEVIWIRLIQTTAPRNAPRADHAPRFVTAEDISEWVHSRNTLQDANVRFDLIAEALNDGIWEWDTANMSLIMSPKACALLDLNPRKSKRSKATSVFHETSDREPSTPERPRVLGNMEEWYRRVVPADRDQLRADFTLYEAGVAMGLDNEHRITDANGQIRWLHARGRTMRDPDGTTTRIIGSLTDITSRKDAQAILERQATHDRLTGLANRELITRRVEEAITRAQRVPGYRYAFMFLDFDRFKLINDSLGHEVGDQLLISIAERLHLQIRRNDVPARLGGDEFAVLLDGVDSLEATLHMAERLQEALAEPHRLGSQNVRSTASIGVVFGHDRYHSASDVIRDADNAMYVAKTRGKAQHALFDEEMHRKSLRRLNLEQSLRGALDADEFRVAYQPIVAIDGSVLKGFEALLRWTRPDGESVSPAEFIPIAEETGEIISIGDYVLRQACQQAVRWNRGPRRLDPLYVNVNVSKRQLMTPDFVDSAIRVLAQTDCDPRWICLEITESSVTDDRCDLLPVLHDIKSCGLGLAMDDFGTGDSSLSKLHQYPLDVLKVDQSFVQPVTENPAYSATIHAIVTLAHSLGFRVVAEGVETQDQFRIMQVLGCDAAQGYLFAKPLMLEAAEACVTGVTPLRRPA